MMKRSRRLGALIVSACGGFIATSLLVGVEIPASAQSESTQPQSDAQLPKPILDVHHLMELFNRPVYEYLKKSVAKQPTEGKGWEEISNRGLQVAEVANLVAIRPRGNSDPEWQEHAASLQQAGVELSEAAKAHDWTATTSAYRQAIGQCNSCHQAKAPEKAPQLEF
jgi:hypothetical protein